MNDQPSLFPLPCPFCGCEAEVREHRYSTHIKYHVQCANDSCKIVCQTVVFDTREKAIEAWNKRA